MEGAVAVVPPARNAIMVEDKYQAFGTGSSRPEPNNAPGIGGFGLIGLRREGEAFLKPKEICYRNPLYMLRG